MSVTAAKGFSASGIACGIKETGALDLALVTAVAGPVPAAATFTTNKAAAAPVVVSRAHLESTGGYAAGVVLNSGCANAATGEAGHRASVQTCDAVAEALSVDPGTILVCSTGLIGPFLPLEKVLSAVPTLVAARASTPEGADAAATAIMTTDTHPKQVTVDGGGFIVGGMAKGAGMIAPNMATMLSVLTTDANIDPTRLRAALRRAVAASFNELIVDGATSTNDTVIVLASGAGAAPTDAALGAALEEACVSLAEQMAADAEGTTRVAHIRVVGAASDEDARRCARGVAGSLLVKASFFGGDPYWGRIVSELGSAGSAFEIDRVSIAYGGTVVAAHGLEVAHDRAAVAAHMAGTQIEIRCDLGLGDGEALVRTTDIGHGYITENMRTS
jgi:glutamate N-acetyltransferase/amino-acid N-acetyltransferase